MSKSFIPNMVNTVCTFQTSSGPSMLIITRSKVTTIYDKSGNARPLMTIEDRNVQVQFTCKAEKHSFFSFVALGAGLILGAALILSGPIGWAVMAAGAIAIGIGIYHATQMKNKCTPGLSAGDWHIGHPTVKIDGASAITQKSILKCEKGGMLTPIFDLATAQKIAGEISSNNNKEVYLDAAVSFFAGLGSVYGFTELGFLKMAAWMVGGTAAVVGGTYGERAVIRNNSMKDNESYKSVNETDENELIPEFVKHPQNTLPDDPANLGDLLTYSPSGYVTGIKDNYNNYQLSKSLSGDLESLKGVNQRDLWKNPKAIEIVSNIRDGKYPDSMIKGSVDGNKVVRPRDLGKMVEDVQEVKTESVNEAISGSVKTGSFIVFFFPFIATYFSEDSRKELAKAMEDPGKGISVMAATQ